MTAAAELPNQNASNSSFEFAALELAENYRAALVAEFLPYLRGRVVEVGAGLGHFSQELCKLPGLESLTAIEPEAELVRQFRTRLPAVELIEGTTDSLGTDRNFDTLVSINVLEHIRDDESELRKYNALLQQRKGYLCLFVPARQEIYAPIDRDFGHHRRYARAALTRKLEHAGFSPVRIEYFNSIGYFLWWLNFRLLKQRRFDVRAVKLFDRTIFPIIHKLETRLARPPLGQSLIAVAGTR